LCFRCANERCKPILDIYVQELSNDIKNVSNHWVLTHALAFWRFGSRLGFHLPSGNYFGSVRVHSITPSYTPGRCSVIPRFPFGSQLYNSFALVTSPRIRLWHQVTFYHQCEIFGIPLFTWIKYVQYDIVSMQ
jgi:hypothetical protein